MGEVLVQRGGDETTNPTGETDTSAKSDDEKWCGVAIQTSAMKILYLLFAVLFLVLQSIPDHQNTGTGYGQIHPYVCMLTYFRIRETTGKNKNAQSLSTLTWNWALVATGGNGGHFCRQRKALTEKPPLEEAHRVVSRSPRTAPQEGLQKEPCGSRLLIGAKPAGVHCMDQDDLHNLICLTQTGMSQDVLQEDHRIFQRQTCKNSINMPLFVLK
ncbi:hypothetical protein KIL84_017358 [Mauremys mutica]|uniref:Uncharacterized protein n=1 Tax=Mauremys mutica TaxID=74926 RepID=A0A9D4AXD6_9SAUR|nr:hypothetical protein KIL84_017358 [Mauremys mutica]